MDIKPLAAARNYLNARPATEPKPGPGDISGGFGTVLQDLSRTLQQGEGAAYATMQGDADPHSLVQALAQTELAVETAVTVRDKVVEAYQEILRMPV